MVDVEVSWSRGTSKSSIYRWIFTYKPSIWGHPHFWKPPYDYSYWGFVNQRSHHWVAPSCCMEPFKRKKKYVESWTCVKVLPKENRFPIDSPNRGNFRGKEKDTKLHSTKALEMDELVWRWNTKKKMGSLSCSFHLGNRTGRRQFFELCKMCPTG